MVDGAGGGVVVEEAEDFAFGEEVAAEGGEVGGHEAAAAVVRVGGDAYDHGGEGVFGGGLGDGEEVLGFVFDEVNAGGAGLEVLPEAGFGDGEGGAEFVDAPEEVEDAGGVVRGGAFGGWGVAFWGEGLWGEAAGGIELAEVGGLFNVGGFRLAELPGGAGYSGLGGIDQGLAAGEDAKV